MSEILTCEWCDCDVVSDEAAVKFVKGREHCVCLDCIAFAARDREFVLAYSDWCVKKWNDRELSFGCFVYGDTLGATKEEQIANADVKVREESWEILIPQAEEYLLADPKSVVQFEEE